MNAAGMFKVVQKNSGNFSGVADVDKDSTLRSEIAYETLHAVGSRRLRISGQVYDTAALTNTVDSAF